MEKWERRLKDLAQLLSNCASTYFDPDLFRLNTNQFLQTARTVTFIIQKHKADIPDFETWYRANIIDAWGNEPLMRWARDARNKIEKEGDLDTNSSLRMTLVFSYFEEEDIEIETDKQQLLHANVKRLIRFAQKHLPTGVSDAAVIRLERRWVTASLPDSELLDALSQVYSRIVACCQSLARYLGNQFPGEIPSGADFGDEIEKARDTLYVKFRNGETVGLRHNRIPMEESPELPAPITAAISEIRVTRPAILSFDSAMQFHCTMARATFESFGNHIPMLFVYDKDWQIVYNCSTEFSDHADKFIFWRRLGEVLPAINGAGLIWTSELWTRKLAHSPSVPIRNMEITGELLQVTGVEKAGTIKQTSWRILRSGAEPTLELLTHPSDYDGSIPYFFIPVMKSLGIADPMRRKTQRYDPFTRSESAV